MDQCLFSSSGFPALINVFCCVQGEKVSEGAGPLRTVKSDGQADERSSAAVNSVSQSKTNAFFSPCKLASALF